MDLILAYSWPGNVRELENTIEYAFARTKGNIIHASKLPPNLRLHTLSVAENEPQKNKNPQEIYASECQLIQNTLEKVHWNRSKAAEILGMGRTTLWRKMKQYGLLHEL